MNIDLWNIYQYNIWHLINSYGLEYKWFTVKELKQVHFKPDELWENGGYWIKQNSHCRIKLALDMIKRGTYFPIFVEKDGQNYSLYGGRHRLESLIKLNHIINIDKKFLVIFFIKPNNEKIIMNKYNCPFLFFSSNTYGVFNTTKCKTFKDIKYFIEKMWGLGTYVLINSGNKNAIPPLIFNNEQVFEEWINNPLPFTYFDILKQYKGKID